MKSVERLWNGHHWTPRNGSVRSMGERMEGEGDLQRAETQKGTETRSQLECEDKKYKKSQSAPGVHKSWGWTMQRPSGGNETLGGQ